MALGATTAAFSPAKDPAATIARLAREASVEINVHDVVHLGEIRRLLPAGKALYISHLPKQQWRETEATCSAVRAAGFRPVPHVPVRLFPDAATVDRVLGRFVDTAQVDEVLLISGDYPQAVGPYTEVLQILDSGALQRHGLRRVTVAGHPEGHPKVLLADIRRAELDKARMAQRSGSELTYLTQFFFEQRPFLDWVRELRSDSGDFTGVHLFCFGGFVRTCRWLQAVADGRFILDDAGGFKV